MTHSQVQRQAQNTKTAELVELSSFVGVSFSKWCEIKECIVIVLSWHSTRWYDAMINILWIGNDSKHDNSRSLIDSDSHDNNNWLKNKINGLSIIY